MKKCSKCGNVFPDANNFCPFCGTPADAGGTPTPSANPFDFSNPAEPPVSAPSFDSGFPAFDPFGGIINQPAEPQGKGRKKAPKTPKAPKAPKSTGKSIGPKAKIAGIATGVVALVVAAAILITSLVGGGINEHFVDASSNDPGNNAVDFRDNINVVENNKLEKKLQDIEYNEDTGEYTMTYETLPDDFKGLKQGDLFVVPSNLKSSNYAIAAGFSGKVVSVGANTIVFTVPKFDEVFSELRIDSNSAQTTGVVFIPEEGVEYTSNPAPQLHNASAGLNTASTNSIKIGNTSAEVSIDNTSKKSKLPGYTLLAESASLKIKRVYKKDKSHSYDFSGKITLDYPAVKFNLDYDGTNKSLNNLDVGFIAKEKLKINVKRTTTVVPPGSEDGIGEYGIIDLKDTSDLEEGKVVLGSYIMGYNVPFFSKQRNGLYPLSVGLCFQLCATVNGKLELEFEAEQSALLRFEKTKGKNTIFEIKHPDAPNPVLGTGSSGKDYTGIKVEVSLSGEFDATLALSVDIGFALLGTIPLKIAVDLYNEEIALMGSVKFDSDTLIEVMKDLSKIDYDLVSYMMVKQQVAMLVDFGFDIKWLKKETKEEKDKEKKKEDTLTEQEKEKKKREITGGEFALKAVVASNVLMQFPEPIPFTLSECDFGGIQLGAAYTEEQMSDAFYQRKGENGKNTLSDKAKDKFLQETVDKLSKKIHFDVQDIINILPLKGKYDLACFSDGAIYFTKNGVVKGELITGDEIYNRSHISQSSTGKFIRQVYSEPKLQTSVKVEIGIIGEKVLNAIGLERIVELNGTDITLYDYSSDDGGNMQVCLDENDEVIFICVY